MGFLNFTDLNYVQYGATPTKLQHVCAMPQKIQHMVSQSPSMDSATIESCVRGHHICKANWSPFKGEKLVCCQEKNNSHDPYAVAVMKGKMIVGHVLRKISAACSLFLDKDDTAITCTITGKRCYSSDLP